MKLNLDDVTAAADGPTPLGEGGGAFLRRSFPPPRPLIEGVLSDEGGGFRGGEEKLGKSIEVLDEIICLTFGLPVLGRFPVPTPRRVLLISEEDSPRRTWRRLRALLRGHDLDPDDPGVQATLDDRLRVSAWAGFRFDDAAMVARFEATLAEVRPDVVYLDVLRKLTRANLNKADEASVFFDRLDDLRRAYDCVFIVVHHYRKSQGQRSGRGSQEMGGSYVLGAWGENSIFFEPLGRDARALVKLDIQVKDAPPAAPLRLVITSDGPPHDPVWLKVRAVELSEAGTGTKNREAILTALRTLAPIPAEDLGGALGIPVDALAKAVGLSEKTVKTHLKLLQTDQAVRIVGHVARQGARGRTRAPLWAAVEAIA